MDSVEDQFQHLKTEWNVLKETWFHGETVDPVFEGMVKDFCTFDSTMQDIYKKVDTFMKGVDQLAEGLLTLSEAVTTGLARVDDSLIVSDSCKLKEATNQITRADAPHSAIAKLRRDMDFNIMNPIRNHLINNRNLKGHLDKRRRRMTDLNSAKKVHDDCVKKGLQTSDRRFLQAKSNLESAKMAFHEVDKHVFEWLYILEEYRGDILDSSLQTLKYLQYEFFATSAHAVSSVLPSRMEFRPMVEMTPEHLEAQVEVELQEAEEGEEEVVTDFSVRLIEKLAKDNKKKPGEGLDSSKNDVPALPVDPLSLSSLLSQGFDEGPARRALRMHQNNTQAALDWLINGGTEGTEAVKSAQVEDGVRMPTTIKRIQKLKAMRRAQQEKMRRGENEGSSADEEKEKRSREPERIHEESTPSEQAPPQKPPDDLIGLDHPSDNAGAQPAQGSGINLLNLDEPPPPMDFTKELNTSALPELRSFDPTMCEKPPLPASVAAGTALPRRDSGDSDTGLLGLMGSTQPSMGSTQPPVIQAQISPQQLLASAQQMAQQQQQQQRTPIPAMSGYGAPPTTSSGLDSLGMLSNSQDALSAQMLAQMPSVASAKPAPAPPKKDALESLDPLHSGLSSF